MIDRNDNIIEDNDILDIEFNFEDKELEKLNLSNHLFYFSEKGKGATPNYLNSCYEEIISLKKGESKSFEIRFTKEVENEEIKGKSKKVTIKLNNVRFLKLPEITEDFLKPFGVKSEEELKEKIKENLDEFSIEKIRTKQELEICEALKKNVNFEIPLIVIDYQIEQRWKEFKKHWQNQLMQADPNSKKSLQLPDQPNKEWAESIKSQVIIDIENELLIDQVKRENEISISEDEVKFEIKKIAKRYNKEFKELRREMIKNEEYSLLKNKLIVKKTFDFLFSKASKKEKVIVSVKDLQAKQ